MQFRPARTAIAVAVSAALALGTAPAHASPDPASAAVAAKPTKAKLAAAWEASQVGANGQVTNQQFGVTDWGLTIDTGLGLIAVGGHRAKVERIASAVKRNYFDVYATDGRNARYAGPFAKTLLFADVIGANVKRFGGHNVRAELVDRMAGDGAGFEAGRVRDKSRFGDFSNTFAQSYAVLGMARTGGVPQAMVDYLVKQQCSDGYFRLSEVVGETCDDSGSAADVDATALAVQALLAAKDDAMVDLATIDAAASWLRQAQRDNGGFSGGTSTPSVNSNSTGLAAQALNALGFDRPAAQAGDFVETLQLTKANTEGRARNDIGAIAYDKAGLKDGLKNGIQKLERDQFRRATAQAVFAFAPKSLVSLSFPAGR